MTKKKRKSPVYKKILPIPEAKTKKISEIFGWLPLSVIEPTNESKAKWKDAYLPKLEIELRRSNDAKYLPGYGHSEFHAGLAENIIHYWSMQGSIIVDPFAGRVTRAHVAASLKRPYYGYEISQRTALRSREHLEKRGLDATIYLADGCEMKQTPDNFADLVFTCPPYHRLEKYESCDNQLSDFKSYSDFLDQIATCGENINRVLKPGAFCVWVCADWKDGRYIPFQRDTMNIFEEAGLNIHDVIILKNNSPFAALQAGKCAAKRYTSKVHEYILVFRKNGEYENPPSEIIREVKETNKFW